MTLPTSPPEYLTVKQTAEHFLCSERTIWRLIETGELKPTRLGRKMVRITRSAIEEYEERNSNQ